MTLPTYADTKQFTFKHLVFLYLLAYACLQLFMIYKTPQIRWDEAVYVGIGKYIWSSGETGLYEAFRPSLLPLIIGALWKAGVNPVLAGKAVALLFSLGNLILLYRVCRQHFEKLLSTLAVVSLSVLPVYFIYSTKIMTGIAASFFILLGYLLYRNERLVLAAFILGLATLTRFPAGMFFIILFLTTAVSKRNLLLQVKLGVSFCAALIPFFAINIGFGYSLLTPLFDAVSHQGNADFMQDPFFYAIELARQSPLLLFSAIGLLTCLFNFRGKIAEVATLMVVPAVYFFLITNRQTRFLNLYMPFILIMGIYGLTRLLDWIGLQRKIVPAMISCIACSSLFFAPYFSHDMDYGKTIKSVYKFPGDGKLVLTTEPIFVAYTDSLYIPAYFNVYDGLEKFAENEKRVDLMIYSDEFECHSYIDAENCNSTKQNLLKQHKAHQLLNQEGRFMIFQGK